MSLGLVAAGSTLGGLSVCFQPARLASEQRALVLVGVGTSTRKRGRCSWARASSSAAVDDPWLQKLPDKKKPLYSHSLPCIEAWLRSLGFVQSNDDRAAWTIQRSDWHARLSLDLTDLFIRYLKSGPGKLDRDMERKFSYALSREDLENAILGGP
ncbi:hypothetical protein GOP47_0020128 [Adiantum capillus-veneris]|uniref:Uncharacterized protein n=1 Tax=Adiantum capillus-veneris TaxID=13818 RepID=A0A9D4UDC5_ADICA|nr:hypothetical protein GOP47_0020128 [Adiantum capillus-veneris]